MTGNAQQTISVKLFKFNALKATVTIKISNPGMLF